MSTNFHIAQLRKNRQICTVLQYAQFQCILFTYIYLQENSIIRNLLKKKHFSNFDVIRKGHLV